MFKGTQLDLQIRCVLPRQNRPLVGNRLAIVAVTCGTGAGELPAPLYPFGITIGRDADRSCDEYQAART